MSPVPQTIPPIQEQAIASFPAGDLITGIGTEVFYATYGIDSGGAVLALNPTPYNSWQIESTGAQTLTFQSQNFNLPRYVKGTAFFNVMLDRISNGGGGTNANCTVQLQRWNGSSATNLTAQHTSGTLSNSAGESKNVYLEMPITTELMVQQGESLRLVFTFVGNLGHFGHSPTNQTSPSGRLSNTIMLIGVPFRSGL